jgi:hypothetical protein|tara:strand:- start:1436 stop:1708 length:273 start_codon:yes stop_codon:yes gene_type:complete
MRAAVVAASLVLFPPISAAQEDDSSSFEFNVISVEGLVHLHLVGIPNPDHTESILAVSNILESQVTLHLLDDLAKTRNGKTLSSFRYRGQ